MMGDMAVKVEYYKRLKDVLEAYWAFVFHEFSIEQPESVKTLRTKTDAFTPYFQVIHEGQKNLRVTMDINQLKMNIEHLSNQADDLWKDATPFSRLFVSTNEGIKTVNNEREIQLPQTRFVHTEEHIYSKTYDGLNSSIEANKESLFLLVLASRRLLRDIEMHYNINSECNLSNMDIYSGYAIDCITRILTMLVTNKIVEKRDDTYVWNKSKVLLAYFVEKVSDKFNLGKGTYTQVVSPNKSKQTNRISWKPFETLFNVNNLKHSKAKHMQANNDFLPMGYEIIDKILG